MGNPIPNRVVSPYFLRGLVWRENPTLFKTSLWLIKVPTPIWENEREEITRREMVTKRLFIWMLVWFKQM